MEMRVNYLTSTGSQSFHDSIRTIPNTQAPKPSCHDAITGIWKPTDGDKACGRDIGFGATINIINGGTTFITLVADRS